MILSDLEDSCFGDKKVKHKKLVIKRIADTGNPLYRFGALHGGCDGGCSLSAG